MPWKMATDPLHNTALSALFAVLPIAALVWALAVKRMRGHTAVMIALLSALAVAVAGFGMPPALALLAAFEGMLFGLFPIAWIVVAAVFLYNLTVATGQLDIIKHSVASITDDRRLQALLIAFSFGAFLEGAAGFGAPVAISAAMLTGLGFVPRYAAGICLIANTAPVAFGAIGIPIIVAGQVSGIDTMAISKIVGRTLLPLSAAIPPYLVVLMAGWRGVREVWPAVVVSGLSFAAAQWWTAEFLGPLLPGIISSLASIISLIVLLKFWHPAVSWRFPHEPAPEGAQKAVRYPAGLILRAWSPFIILTIFVAAWGIPSVKQTLDSLALTSVELPGLHHMIIRDGTALPAVFTLNYLSAAGTAILFAALCTMALFRIPAPHGLHIFTGTVATLRFPLLTIAGVLGFAYVANLSGISIALGNAFAATGPLFPFFSPLIGWLGVFITGSDTSANALFARLQEVTAARIGVDPVITVGANSSGGVTAKMISPQSIAVATAAVGLAGHESDIFRFTLKHSLILGAAIAVFTVLQAYVITWIVPAYGRTAAPAATAAKGPALTVEGIAYLGIALALVLTVSVLARTVGERRVRGR